MELKKSQCQCQNFKANVKYQKFKRAIVQCQSFKKTNVKISFFSRPYKFIVLNMEVC